MADSTVSLGRLRSDANCVKAMMKSLFMSLATSLTHPNNRSEQKKWGRPTFNEIRLPPFPDNARKEAGTVYHRRTFNTRAAWGPAPPRSLPE
jgi:hypothetical protein